MSGTQSAALRQRGSKKKDPRAGDPLLLFWFWCSPEDRKPAYRGVNLYCGGVNGARPADVTKLIGVFQKKGPRASEKLKSRQSTAARMDAYVGTYLSERTAASHLTEQEQAFSQIDDKWRAFLEKDLPKIRSIVAALWTHCQMEAPHRHRIRASGSGRARRYGSNFRGPKKKD